MTDTPLLSPQVFINAVNSDSNFNFSEKLTEARATVVWFVDLTKQIDHVLRPEWSFDNISSTLNGAEEDDEDLIID